MTPYCHLSLSGPLAIIEFGTPSHNALPSGILDQMVAHLEEVNKDPDIRLVLIRSQGERSFCAGADLGELLTIKDEEEGKRFFYQFARVILAIRNSPHLVITRVQGKAVGGGLGLIAASDLTYATDQAEIRLAELINGIGPFVVGPAIERKTGLSAFNHLSLNPATWFSASWAMEHGLYNEVFHITDAMDEHITEKIDELSGYSRAAMNEIKKMMWTLEPEWDQLLLARAGISGRLLMTVEARTALQAIHKK